MTISLPKKQTGDSFNIGGYISTSHSWRNGTKDFTFPLGSFFLGGFRDSDTGVLVNRLLTNFTKALEIQNTDIKVYHLSEVTRVDEFLRAMSGSKMKCSSVSRQEFSTAGSQQPAENQLNCQHSGALRPAEYSLTKPTRQW